jgi:NTE family protein
MKIAYSKIFVYTLLIFFCQYIYSQTHKYENLVFEGAGIRGIAYSGVIHQLEERKVIDGIINVGGTSAGAITALMISLGYNSTEIYDIISSTKFQKFNDGQYVFIGGFARLKNRYGWYKDNEFTKWLEKIISDKTNNSEITFAELREKGFRNLFVTATCMNKQKLMVLSAQTYPKMMIKDAVRVSMSIPFYFEAAFVDSVGKVYSKQNSNGDLDIMVDGGIIGNFPIFMFDTFTADSMSRRVRIPDYKTLGIRIDTDEQIENDNGSKELVPIKIDNMADYLTSFYILVLENLNRNQLIPEDWDRTISVSSVGIGPRIKRLTDGQKKALIQSGEIRAGEFFDKQKDPATYKSNKSSRLKW